MQTNYVVFLFEVVNVLSYDRLCVVVVGIVEVSKGRRGRRCPSKYKPFAL